jgi:hypothetical protein
MHKYLILNNIFLRRLAAWWLAGSVAVAHAAIPSAASVTYQLFRNGILLGTITEHFEIRDGQYHATSEARAQGLFALAQRDPVRYVSSGAVTREGLRPLRFEGHHRGKAMFADFDWAASKLSLAHDGLTHVLALPAGTQDRLSIMYQMMFAMRSAPATMDFMMTNGRKLEKYRYAVRPNVTIDVPVKRLVTTHLVKQREADDTGTEVWIAPEFGNVAVKVVIIEDDGVRYEQVATRVDIQP